MAISKTRKTVCFSSLEEKIKLNVFVFFKSGQACPRYKKNSGNDFRAMLDRRDVSIKVIFRITDFPLRERS